MRSTQKCPHCGSDSIYRSHRGLFERLLFGVRPFRCGTCLKRFRIFVSRKNAKARTSTRPRPLYVTEVADREPVRVYAAQQAPRTQLPIAIPVVRAARPVPFYATGRQRLIPWYLIRR